MRGSCPAPFRPLGPQHGGVWAASLALWGGGGGGAPRGGGGGGGGGPARSPQLPGLAREAGLAPLRPSALAGGEVIKAGCPRRGAESNEIKGRCPARLKARAGVTCPFGEWGGAGVQGAQH